MDFPLKEKVVHLSKYPTLPPKGADPIYSFFTPAQAALLVLTETPTVTSCP